MEGDKEVLRVGVQADTVIVVAVLAGVEVHRDDLARPRRNEALLVAPNLDRR